METMLYQDYKYCFNYNFSVLLVLNLSGSRGESDESNLNKFDCYLAKSRDKQCIFNSRL